MKCKFQSGKTKSKISLAVRIESNSKLSACLDKGFCSRSHIIRQNGKSLIPIFRCLLAALYAGDYIGAQFIHTSADGSVRGDEFGFVDG